MKEVIYEYGSAFLATGGAFLFLGIMGNILFAGDGLFMKMIQAWTYGGC